METAHRPHTQPGRGPVMSTRRSRSVPFTPSWVVASSLGTSRHQPVRLWPLAHPHCTHRIHPTVIHPTHTTQAMKSGVSPLISAFSRSAPALSSWSTTHSCPFCGGGWNGCEQVPEQNLMAPRHIHTHIFHLLGACHRFIGVHKMSLGVVGCHWVLLGVV